MVKKIIFIGDLLRYQDGMAGFADRSLLWEYNLFKEQIYQATGIVPEVYCTNTPENFDYKKFYELCGYELSTENWINIVCGRYTDQAREYVKECFQDALVISQVLGSFKCIFDELNIPYIDIYVSSIKFCDDLYFAFRSNIESLNNKLSKYKIKESNLWIYAAYVKSYYSAHPKNLSCEKNSLLLCGQNDVDLALIKDDKMISFLILKKKIEKLVSEYKTVYYKPHPYAKANNDNENFIRRFSNVKLINENIYRLMSVDEITDVAALSSGTLTEAKYFGKKAIYISHKFVNYCFSEKYKKDDFIIVDRSYYSPKFWADVLSEIMNTNKDCIDFHFDRKHNLLRNSLNVVWGYEIEPLSTRIDADLKNIQSRFKHERDVLNTVDLDNTHINYLEQNATQEAAESKDISVIVQGSVDFQETQKCLMSVRKNLPEAEIILSTWEGSETKGLDYDVLVLSTDPGGMPMEPITWKINNVNRQITSTLNGIKKATRKYILKIRTDSRIDNLGFLNCFNDNIFQNLKRDKDYSVLKRRVAIGSHFTRDPLHGNSKLLFHPSDFWFFGLKEDLENIFDIPLQTKFIVTINGRKYQYRVPEQYIWTSCLEKNGFSFFMDSLLYNTPLLADISIKSILNNFIVLDSKRCGIRFPAKFKDHSKGVMNDSILSTARYFEFYRKFYDNNYDPPKIFQYDNIKDALGITHNIAEIKGILASNDLFRMARCILAIGYKSIRNSYKLLWQLK